MGLLLSVEQFCIIQTVNYVGINVNGSRH